MLPEVPIPVLFNSLKHHVSTQKGLVEAFASPDVLLDTLPAALLPLGASQMDVYTGSVSPQALADEVLVQLRANEALKPAHYQAFLKATGSDYRLLELSDSSQWVLRWGEEPGRYVHLHPARYSPHTVRAKASALKTALASLVYQRRCGYQATTTAINQVRQRVLGLSPLRSLAEATAVIAWLEYLNRDLLE